MRKVTPLLQGSCDFCGGTAKFRVMVEEPLVKLVKLTDAKGVTRETTHKNFTRHACEVCAEK